MEVTTQSRLHDSQRAFSRHELDDDASPLTLAGRATTSIITPAGSGGIRYEGLAVTRWAGDPTCDADGVHLFLRDLEDNRFWSAGYQPTAVEPDECEVNFSVGRANFRRLDHGIQVELDVCVCSEHDVELRRYTVSNRSGRRRTLQITSYLEWVLQDAAADAAHPAFSKIFVETEYIQNRSLIIARRRQRDPHARTLTGAHWIACAEPAMDAAAMQFETNRMRFIGRGGSLRTPAAMRTATLSGDSGPVLDPIASLRTSFSLAVDESACVTFGVAARDDATTLLKAVPTLSAREIEQAFQRAEHWASQHPATAVNGPHILLRRTASANGASQLGELRRIDQRHRITAADEGAEADAYSLLRETMASESATDDRDSKKKQFDNSLGAFSADGREYRITLRPDADGRLQLPPLPWTHIVANPNAGFIATETGAGYTWTVNSRENRLTHWLNDPVCDPHSEALFLRDRDRNVFWSPTPGPAGPPVVHHVRYGFGTAKYEQTSAELRQQVTQFVPASDAVKISLVSLQNLSRAPRKLDLFYYAQLALGNGDRQSAAQTTTWFDAESQSIFATNPGRELSTRVAFAALIVPQDDDAPRYTGDRTEFLGRHGTLNNPVALRSNKNLSGRCGADLDPCAVLQRSLQLEGDSSAQYWVLLGEAETVSEARQLIARYSTAAAIDATLSQVETFWQETLGAVQIDTPSVAMNFMVNGWLPYQNLCCRLWGRSAYYQSGGAYGFRDQLQDSAALVYHDPQITRTQILRHAASQFLEGDVLHWWHPHSDRGIRTRFSDDLLWLPLVAAEYAETTGDASLWDQQAGYVTGPQLEPNEAERFFAAKTAAESSSIYEHCCRAIDRSLCAGVHGLPLIGCGDWNDGMNRVGQAGRGESVWMGFFLHKVLDRMLPVCHARGDAAREREYREYQQRLRISLNDAGWDGGWFRRAYFDDGEPLGSAAAEECQIDALVQAWAVLSGGADDAKAALGMAAVEERLVDEHAGLIRLLDPPFDRMPHDPGYIKGYLPGVRENGGQYTHGVLWFVRAMAELGRGSRAVELLDMLNPINHARTPAEVNVYQAEPYVIAADVYSQPPHVGRAGWTWYTGSAGWMFRVAVESILGLRIRDGRELLLNPSIAASWPNCRLRYRLPNAGGVYEISIENSGGRERGVTIATLDGEPAPVDNGVARIPLHADGRTHHVELHL